MSAPTASASNQLPAGSGEYEAAHVHEVYQRIAPHFSATRFKPWPIVERFLREMATGSVGLDIGCGNGKYLAVNPNVFLIGSDRSSNLVAIAHGRKVHDSVVADGLSLPHPEARFDFAISIAVVHHFSSRERRIAAIKEILAMLKRNNSPVTSGKALIYVWALEQKSSRRGWGEGDSQDVFVPWVLSKRFTKPKSSTGVQKVSDDSDDAPKNAPDLQCSTDDTSQRSNNDTPKEAVFQRYYHLYRNGELEADIASAGGHVLEAGYEKDNWWAVCCPQA